MMTALQLLGAVAIVIGLVGTFAEGKGFEPLMSLHS